MERKRLMTGLLVCAAALGAWAGGSGVNPQRHTLCYAEGYEPGFWPKSLAFTPDKIADIHLQRLLAEAPVKPDTLIYKPIGMFGLLSANVPSAEYPKWQPDAKSWRMRGIMNRMPDFVKAGTDPLKEVCKWARKNSIEMIVSMPVNNTHYHTDWKIGQTPTTHMWENFYLPPWKVANQPVLMGGKMAKMPKDIKPSNVEQRPPYGTWHDVDYTEESVRAKFVAMVKDLAKYDVDGVLIDFMNEPMLFKSVAWGGVASPKECALITDMLTQIRAAVPSPMTLSIRIPDSMQYCKDIGIDLTAIFAAKLVDFVIAGGDFQCNPWSYMGDISAKNNVPYYADFSQSLIWVGNDSGYKGDDELLPRHSPECFRARAQDALNGGAAGCCYTQPYHWIRFRNKCVVGGTLDQVSKGNKRYYVSYRSSSYARSYVVTGAKYVTLPTLHSDYPVDLAKGPSKQNINVWDDVKKTNPIRCEVTTEIVIPSGMDVEMTVNGKKAKQTRKQAGRQKFEIPNAAIKHGPNEIIVKAIGRNKRGQTAKLGNVTIDVIYEETEVKSKWDAPKQFDIARPKVDLSAAPAADAQKGAKAEKKAAPAKGDKKAPAKKAAKKGGK